MWVVDREESRVHGWVMGGCRLDTTPVGSKVPNMDGWASMKHLTTAVIGIGKTRGIANENGSVNGRGISANGVIEIGIANSSMSAIEKVT